MWKMKTPEVATLGFSIPIFVRQGLAPQARYRLLITVQPFANEVANHTCHNGEDKGYSIFHVMHPLPVASIGAVTLAL